MVHVSQAWISFTGPQLYYSVQEDKSLNILAKKA